jgi:capsular polysaccharide biosynthesis protein
MGPTDRIYVEDLILPSLPERRGNPPAWACRFLRDWFLPLADEASVERPSRIYVGRRGTREVTNQNAVDAVLARHGITTVHPREHSLGVQVALFQNADLVVGPHGAGLANIVFAASGTQVVEIFSSNYVNVCNASIASRLDLHYSYLIGKGERPPSGVDPFHVYEDITVEVEQLDQWLCSLAN